MDEDTANAFVDSPELVKNSFRFSVLFVCCCFYLHVCLLYKVLSFYFFFYLFLTIVRLTFTQTLRLQAQSMAKTNPVPGFDQPPPF